MTIEEITQCLLDLSDERKASQLASVAHFVTVAARDNYPGMGNDAIAIERLVTYNEVLHNVSSHIRALIDHSDKRYPDDILVRILFEKARAGNCERELLWAFQMAFSRAPAA